MILFIFYALLFHLVLGQNHIGCFVPGECIRSYYVAVNATQTPDECLEACIVKLELHTWIVTHSTKYLTQKSGQLWSAFYCSYCESNICVTNFGVVPLKSNHFSITVLRIMQRAPKEPLDYGAVLINFWRQLAQAWRHRGPFCDMAFESKIAFFSFIISGEMDENWSSFITFLTFYLKFTPVRPLWRQPWHF